MLDLIDSHCHLDFEVFDNERSAMIQKLTEVGINHLIIPAVNASGWQNLIQLCQSHPNLHYALGLHPMFLAEHHPDQLAILKQHIKHNRPLAIGEIGLDFYNKETNKKLQAQFFQAQLMIAKEAQLPVLMHIRKTHDLVINVLKKIPQTGGICHAFNGTIRQAHSYIEMGFLLGFGGTLTYPNAPKIKHLAQTIPLESIVLETDSPDMPTASNKGGINSPFYLAEICQALAEIKGVNIERVAQQTSANVKKLFNL